MLQHLRTDARYPFGRLVFQTLIDLIFPAACSGCGRVDIVWCWHCQHELATTPVIPHTRSDTLVSSGVHSGILQQALHGLKYDNLPQLARPLAARLAQLLRTLDWSPDLIIPIPSHSSRVKARGYNQAQLLADALATLTGISCAPDAAQRIRETRSQVGLNHKERQQNVANAFWVDESQVENKTVLLVDDVLTTGATINACGQTIRAAGARQVYGMTVTTATT
jgi:ComF family protein